MDDGRTFVDPTSPSTTITVVNTSDVSKNMMVTVLRFSCTVFFIIGT
jgi:hypothetical protein